MRRNPFRATESTTTRHLIMTVVCVVIWVGGGESAVEAWQDGATLGVAMFAAIAVMAFIVAVTHLTPVLESVREDLWRTWTKGW